jgi:hypothetical protein
MRLVKKKSEESKCSDSKNFDVDNFYSLYHLELTLKDRKKNFTVKKSLYYKDVSKCFKKKSKHTMIMN